MESISKEEPSKNKENSIVGGLTTPAHKKGLFKLDLSRIPGNQVTNVVGFKDPDKMSLIKSMSKTISPKNSLNKLGNLKQEELSKEKITR